VNIKRENLFISDIDCIEYKFTKSCLLNKDIIIGTPIFLLSLIWFLYFCCSI